jgi:hypothetical protein
MIFQERLRDIKRSRGLCCAGSKARKMIQGVVSPGTQYVEHNCEESSDNMALDPEVVMMVCE